MNANRTLNRTKRAMDRVGFTLIEFVGVLAIISVLALVVVETIIKRVDLAAVNTEKTILNSLTNAIALQILRNNQIPSEATWASAAGNWLALPSASITTNARRYARAYLIDKSGWLTNLQTTGYYTQTTTNGTKAPAGARILIVSSLSAALPVASGRPTTAVFNDLWNTSPGQLPANAVWNGWKGRADDLQIQRLNLQPLFYQIVLLNRDATNAAGFSINGGQTNLLAGHAGVNAYYLAGSEVNLLTATFGSTNSVTVGEGSGGDEGGGDNEEGDFGGEHQNGGGGGGATHTVAAVQATVSLQTSCILNHNISYVFENGMWGGRIGIGPTTTASAAPTAKSFTTNSLNFLTTTNSPRNSGSGGAAGDQEQVLAAMNDFMTVYTLWAGENFTLHGMSSGQAKNHLSIYNYLQTSANRLGNVAGTTRNTNSAPFYSGLLY